MHLKWLKSATCTVLAWYRVNYNNDAREMGIDQNGSYGFGHQIFKGKNVQHNSLCIASM